jgi:putative transposase
MIKGRFSYRLAKEYGYEGEVWQRGFSEVQVMNAQDLEKCRNYIAANPVKARLVNSADEYPFCFRYLASRKAEMQGLKPR